jgi:hypothetical protein
MGNINIFGWNATDTTVGNNEDNGICVAPKICKIVSLLIMNIS